MTSEAGIGIWFASGEAVTIAGVKYVKVGAALIEDGPQFHDTPEDAQSALADQIEEIGLRILAQAKKYRREVQDGSPLGG
jgi:hypothetical protein